MDKERLAKLSMENLLSLAETEEIDVPQCISREDLIEIILEAYEDEKSDHDNTNNPAMRVKETKYDIVLNRMLGSGNIRFSIPEAYNETYIKLMLRDPFWAFAYWELKDADLEIIRDGLAATEPFLRVYEVDNSPETPSSAISFFDIPVQITDNSWYINLPKSGKSYYIDLMYRSGKAEKLLCTSNKVSSPEATYSLLKEGGGIADAGNDLVLLSGLYDFEAAGRENIIPQRIISFLDAQYIQLKD